MTPALFDCANARASCFIRRAAHLIFFLILLNAASLPVFAQQSSELTPSQREIERERRRLASAETEERRDAVLRLGWMKRPDSSRVAALALKDPAEIVRATAATAILSLPPDEAAALLLPLLQDKKEFVRQEAAYALGQTRSPSAIAGLVGALETDKQPSVRGAAAVALGLIGDTDSARHLADVIAPEIAVPKNKRRKREDNEFVLRAAARALGQIKSRGGILALAALMSDKRASDDVKREAVRALGLIDAPLAVPILRAALTASDPYLSRIAYEALLKISPADAVRPQ